MAAQRPFARKPSLTSFSESVRARRPSQLPCEWVWILGWPRLARRKLKVFRAQFGFYDTMVAARRGLPWPS
jgi:hypothetical protein